ncbi:SixA phosphatase family protein [Planctellipticum variicoloris]|uniref:SixA phosphatase family protein n=1 Tax=Planctellipticum variicoloris TaxID=3064265 RepID=UPI00301406AF|nr:histidine phosphatase family protein [Planctomycetaceae bacterium SH412]
MKTLCLMRHAKSSWEAPELADHDRPLNVRGRRAAPQIARWLGQHDLRPDFIICSTAVRAQETVKLLRAEWLPVKFDDCPELYMAGPEQLKSVVSTFPDDVSCLLLVAHNPGLEEWLAELTGVQRKFPTAAVAVLDADVDHWSDWPGPAKPTLRVFHTPKQLTDN